MPTSSTSTTRSYARSSQLYAEACEVLAGGVSSNFRLWGHPVPLSFERGEGARLYDVDGNTYLDYALGMGPNILGHAAAPIIRAVADSLSQGQLFAGQHRQEVLLARRIQELVPCAQLVRFGVSGSEMAQIAMRLARAFTGRPRVVKFEGHYHGWFDTILVSVAPPVKVSGPHDAPVAYLPSAGQSKAAAADIDVLLWNNLDMLHAHLEAHAAQTAAIIMEPIQCNTGVISPLPGYLEGVRELCNHYGVVLIFDEVITGFRVGLGGAQSRLGVTPDLAVFAKSVGGGFPLAVVAGKREIMQLAGNGAVLHGGTFNAHTASIAAGLATLEELSRNGGQVYDAMSARGSALMDGLRELGRKAGLPLHVQGVGAAFNTAFTEQTGITDSRSYQACDLNMQQRFLGALQDAGVRPTSRGTWFLSAAHTDADIDETLAAAAEALCSLTSAGNSSASEARR